MSPASLSDVLGIKPIGEAVKIATEAMFKGAGEFLSRICLPAAEEYGLLLQDHVKHWRATNAAKMLALAEAKVAKFTRGEVLAHPRLVSTTIENASWTDDDVIQDAWAGILASSCTEDGRDDSNVIFASLLTQLTGVQLRLLNHAIEKSNLFATQNGFPFADSITLPVGEMIEMSGCEDVHRLDREIDHLVSLALLRSPGFFGGAGFNVEGEKMEASFRVSPLALHLYVRGQGFVGSPVEFFGLIPKPDGSAPDK